MIRYEALKCMLLRFYAHLNNSLIAIMDDFRDSVLIGLKERTKTLYLMVSYLKQMLDSHAFLQRNNRRHYLSRHAVKF